MTWFFIKSVNYKNKFILNRFNIYSYDLNYIILIFDIVIKFTPGSNFYTYNVVYHQLPRPTNCYIFRPRRDFPLNSSITPQQKDGQKS
jgi:hypothetical protein